MQAQVAGGTQGSVAVRWVMFRPICGHLLRTGEIETVKGSCTSYHFHNRAILLKSDIYHLAILTHRIGLTILEEAHPGVRACCYLYRKNAPGGSTGRFIIPDVKSLVHHREEAHFLPEHIHTRSLANATSPRTILPLLALWCVLRARVYRHYMYD